MSELPQYHKHNLIPVDISQGSLRETLKELRIAIKRGADLVQNGSPPADEWGEKGMFNGTPGMYTSIHPRRRVFVLSAL